QERRDADARGEPSERELDVPALGEGPAVQVEREARGGVERLAERRRERVEQREAREERLLGAVRLGEELGLERAGADEVAQLARLLEDARAPSGDDDRKREGAEGERRGDAAEASRDEREALRAALARHALEEGDRERERAHEGEPADREIPEEPPPPLGDEEAARLAERGHVAEEAAARHEERDARVDRAEPEHEQDRHPRLAGEREG